MSRYSLCRYYESLFPFLQERKGEEEVRRQEPAEQGKDVGAQKQQVLTVVLTAAKPPLYQMTSENPLPGSLAVILTPTELL